ncbi:hypothetical protein R6Q59_031091 [Mikania micrantha]
MHRHNHHHQASSSSSIVVIIVVVVIINHHASSSSSSSIMHHHHLFHGTVTRARLNQLLRKLTGQQKAIDYDKVGERQRIVAIIGEDTPWPKPFELAYTPRYRLITLEFLSAFMYHPLAEDFQP